MQLKLNGPKGCRPCKWCEKEKLAHGLLAKPKITYIGLGRCMHENKGRMFQAYGPWLQSPMLNKVSDQGVLAMDKVWG